MYQDAAEEEVDPIQELIDFGMTPEQAQAIHAYAVALEDEDDEE